MKRKRKDKMISKEKESKKKAKISVIFKEEEVMKILRSIAEALQVCHCHHILHGDIRPQTVFIASDGTYKISILQNFA